MAWSKTAAQRQRDTAVYDSAYRKRRLACLKRANWRCEIRIPGKCIGAASECDHTAQAANDPQHKQLRAACKPCHAVVTARQSNAGNGSRADPQPQPRTAW